ncbi:MAG: hypothetical protein IPP40_06290 [bacterium]|nr:hypothetical protein [bacterium]
MRNVFLVIIALIAGGLSMSCEQGIDEDNSSARVSGFVYRSHSDPPVCRVLRSLLRATSIRRIHTMAQIVGSKQTRTDTSRGYMFLGSNEDTGAYIYVADFLIQYFYNDAPVGVSTGGITLSPGSSFTMPPRYLNQ